MDINKLSNKKPDHGLNKSGASSQSRQVPESSKSGSPSDKVSIKNIGLSKNEKRFAKIELEKLNQSSFDRLNQMHKDLSTYKEAKADSPEAARETEIGKKLNDPDVWAEIARGIIGK